MSYATGITDDIRPADPALDQRPAFTWDGAGPLQPVTAFEWVERGWRPALGWVCGLAFFYNFVAAPSVDAKESDEGKLWVIATVALGLAGVRTIERVGPQMVRK